MLGPDDRDCAHCNRRASHSAEVLRILDLIERDDQGSLAEHEVSDGRNVQLRRKRNRPLMADTTSEAVEVGARDTLDRRAMVDSKPNKRRHRRDFARIGFYENSSQLWAVSTNRLAHWLEAADHALMQHGRRCAARAGTGHPIPRTSVSGISGKRRG